jgi:hypothetical protein
MTAEIRAFTGHPVDRHPVPVVERSRDPRGRTGDALRGTPGAADSCGSGEWVDGRPEYLADWLEADAPDRGERVYRQHGSPCRAAARQLPAMWSMGHRPP